MKPRTDDDPDLDYSERNGFLTGKAAALSDWSFRREQKSFEKLVARLRAARWRKANPDLARESNRRTRLKHGARYNERQRNRRRVVAARRRKPRTCEQCRRTWTPLRARSTYETRFCSRRCRNAWHGRIRSRAKNRGIRNRQLEPTLRAVLVERPWLTLPELVAAMSTAKRGSIASKLTALIQTGEVVHDGAKKWRRYALPGTRAS